MLPETKMSLGIALLGAGYIIAIIAIWIGGSRRRNK